MGDQIDDSARLIPCSFCDEKCSPLAIGEHLMMCGNKTDQCPNCRKYIRRAIFAYHYENNCSNPEESDTDVRAPANQPDTSSTVQPNNPSQSPSRSAVENNKRRTEKTVDLSTHPRAQDTAAQRQDSDFCESRRVTMRCSYCYQECEISERDKHLENCLRNPANIKSGQLSGNNGMWNRDSDRSHHAEQLDDVAIIPCELCREPIIWCHFEEHLKACAEREQKRTQTQSRSTNEANNGSFYRCKHCNAERTMVALRVHEAICTKNPLRLAFEAQFKRVFNPLPLYN